MLDGMYVIGKKAQEPDYENKKGTVIAYSQCKVMRAWRKELLILIEEFDEDFVAEGNLYYNVLKTGIGFHGDAERRKVVQLVTFVMKVLYEGTSRFI